MLYEIEWTAAALRELRKLDKQASRRIALAVTALGSDPRPFGCRALTGLPSGVMRIRVGDYRVVYQVEDTRVVVTVVRVAHRREVYRDL
ncbi:RelE/StbE replicon stabilization toxin [Actinokineospora spheciospongiae]|uniref:RelE/StbE replicon stabilization toxin n=1 Tax=Actinokineospora spheciospongiae TaxID=909613 RepID=W7J2L9_9PSEU|nr:type II toxin-antitoxin system RelE/ParE family toxin [Actinokineospora spheciospongiae]EWC60374.1 RelE/StbE replicon stabilization toxin [Actinokineospora spheciospongiae]PWW61827.1 addiction module RelE/StbE family toxin [Actinokineospora spheciospongiae]